MDNSIKKADILARSFVSYLKKNNEEHLLGDVLKILSKSAADEKVSVIAPRVLSKSEEDAVLKLVMKLVKNKKVSIEYLVDDSIIDGLKIEYKDKLWDFSFAKQIGSLFDFQKYFS